MDRSGTQKDNSRTGFLNPGATGILGKIILSLGGCPVNCRVRGSIPGLYPQDASSKMIHHPTCGDNNIANVPWEVTLDSVENHWLT